MSSEIPHSSPRRSSRFALVADRERSHHENLIGSEGGNGISTTYSRRIPHGKTETMKHPIAAKVNKRHRPSSRQSFAEKMHKDVQKHEIHGTNEGKTPGVEAWVQCADCFSWYQLYVSEGNRILPFQSDSDAQPSSHKTSMSLAGYSDVSPNFTCGCTLRWTYRISANDDEESTGNAPKRRIELHCDLREVLAEKNPAVTIQWEEASNATSLAPNRSKKFRVSNIPIRWRSGESLSNDSLESWLQSRSAAISGREGHTKSSAPEEHTYHKQEICNLLEQVRNDQQYVLQQYLGCTRQPLFKLSIILESTGLEE